MSYQTAEGSTLFERPMGYEESFARGWKWAIPAAMRQCIGQALVWRSVGGSRHRFWVDTGAYSFHEGCLIFDHVSGPTLSLDSPGQRSLFAVQVEDATPAVRGSKGYVGFRWFRRGVHGWDRLEADLQSCTQVEFVRRLRVGMKPPKEQEWRDE